MMGSLAVSQPSTQTQTQTSSSTTINVPSHPPPSSQPASMEATLHTPLTALETALTTLTSTLTSNPTYAAAPSALTNLLSADASLTTALHTLRTHQSNYTHILALRAQASELEQRIQSTVRDCIDLRRQIGDIYPGNLRGISTDDKTTDRDLDSETDSDSESDVDGRESSLPSRRKRRDVRYDHLLPFAARLGRYNAAAAASIVQNPPPTTTTTSSPLPNGSITPAARALVGNPTTSPPAATGLGTEASTALIPAHEHLWLDSETAMLRDRGGMAFPAAERLRMGLLGKVQLARERAGEAGVEGLLRELGVEGSGDPHEDERGQEGRDEGDVKKEMSVEAMAVKVEVEGGVRGEPTKRMEGTSTLATVSVASRPEPTRQKPLVKNLDLDLYNEDDDDDDD